jgi:hypothetical protein
MASYQTLIGVSLDMANIKLLKPKIKFGPKSSETIGNFVNLHSTVPDNCVFELDFSLETLNANPEILGRACGIEMGCIPYDENAIYLINKKEIVDEVKLHLLFKFNYRIFARDECFDVIKDLIERYKMNSTILDDYCSTITRRSESERYLNIPTRKSEIYHLRTNRMWDGFSMLGWALVFSPESKIVEYLIKNDGHLKVPSPHEDTASDRLKENHWFKYFSNVNGKLKLLEYPEDDEV